MSAAVISTHLHSSSLADNALKAAAAFWLAVTVVGQFIFALAVASFYGLTALRVDRPSAHVYVP